MLRKVLIYAFKTVHCDLVTDSHESVRRKINKENKELEKSSIKMLRH